MSDEQRQRELDRIAHQAEQDGGKNRYHPPHGDESHQIPDHTEDEKEDIDVYKEGWKRGYEGR